MPFFPAAAKVPLLTRTHTLGLLILPSLLPPETQKLLLARLVHRDLSNPRHQTNMHLHYQLPYPDPAASFFSHAPDSAARFDPKDSSVHKPLSVGQVMDRSCTG